MRINPVIQNKEKQTKIIDFESAKTNKEKEVTFTLEELEDTLKTKLLNFVECLKKVIQFIKSAEI